MKMQVKDFAAFTGVSVRTLHYYDEIGLLKPAVVEGSSGYRYYDETSLSRMQEILFYRELDFPLKSICGILSSPNYDKEKALLEQKELLTMKKERLERLIAAVDDALKGEIVMDAFENNDFEQYRSEVEERWGKTRAYAEYAEKRKDFPKDKHNAMLAGMEKILGEFAICMENGHAPDSSKAQSLVRMLQEYITVNFYNCTIPILSGLGQMYVADERFKKNIDKHGDGTAAFISLAIRAYCG